MSLSLPGPRQALQAAIFALARRIGAAAIDLFHGRRSVKQFQARGGVLLVESHTTAAGLGRNLAGDRTPFSPLDAARGRQAAAHDLPYLAGFAQAIRDGRYADEDGGLLIGAMKPRLLLYGRRLTGTANAAWAGAKATQEDPTEVLWVLGGAVDHCRPCVMESELGWRPFAELTRHPGDSSTPCLSNCACSLLTRDGSRSFRNGY